MKFETENLSNKYIDAIGEIIPAVVTETIDKDGNFKNVIDFDKLKTLLDVQGGGYCGAGR